MLPCFCHPALIAPSLTCALCDLHLKRRGGEGRVKTDFQSGQGSPTKLVFLYVRKFTAGDLLNGKNVSPLKTTWRLIASREHRCVFWLHGDNLISQHFVFVIWINWLVCLRGISIISFSRTPDNTNYWSPTKRMTVVCVKGPLWTMAVGMSPYITWFPRCPDQCSSVCCMAQKDALRPFIS